MCDTDLFSSSFFPHENCGIFGVFGSDIEAARIVHSGLWALQHRGQESSGIASSEGTSIRVVKDEGLVAHVYSEELLDLLSGNIAIGHNRYGTSGGTGSLHAQPIKGQRIALAHNGNLPSTSSLKNFLTKQKYPISNMNDSEMMHAALEHIVQQGGTIQQAVRQAFPLFTGAFCLLIMTNKEIVAVRDKKGIRPLSLGKLSNAFVVSSETCALDTVGAHFVRDIRPGEMLTIDRNGIHSTQIVTGTQKLDIFEFIYFARPDSILLGKSVHEVRRKFGQTLATEVHLDVDTIIPVPDSAIPAALGYSQQSGILFDHGLVKNRYIHRTFIRPAQKLRMDDVDMKLNPVREVIAGKRVAIVDDSIVRGTTAKRLAQKLRTVGAKEVHMLISSPPVLYPDFYGIDTPSQNELIASRMDCDKIAQTIGVDSLHFLSYKGMMNAIDVDEKLLSTSCFTGKYPISLKERAKEVTHLKATY